VLLLVQNHQVLIAACKTICTTWLPNEGHIERKKS
jgi:hypothetical protein